MATLSPIRARALDEKFRRRLTRSLQFIRLPRHRRRHPPPTLNPRFNMLMLPRIERIIAGLLGAPTIIVIIALIWGGVFSW